MLATPLTVILVVLGRHVEALKFFDILLGDEPALSESEALYQRMLAHDPVEAVEHAKAFMTGRSLSEYCNSVARPALTLARKDAERGALEGDVLAKFHGTVEGLFADIAHEHWVLRGETRGTKEARPGSLPIVHAQQLTGRWRSTSPLVSIGAQAGLDEAAAAVIATLAQTHGVATRIEKPDALTAAQLDQLDLSDAALVCLSCLDLKTPSRIHYAARRIRMKAPHAKLMLGLWNAADDAALETIRDAVNADYAVRTFHAAAACILDEATHGGLLHADARTAAAAPAAKAVGANPRMINGSATA